MLRFDIAMQAIRNRLKAAETAEKQKKAPPGRDGGGVLIQFPIEKRHAMADVPSRRSSR
ncbi:MAG: hypothetical protein INR68_14870 [Methylobacterium mesophilicum]|nr:hypothetical protein [Methylobacterium mesophilicum]